MSYEIRGQKLYIKKWQSGTCHNRYIGLLTDEIQSQLNQDDKLDDYCKQVKATIKDILESAGFHQPKRGKWRLKRMKDVIKPGKDVTLSSFITTGIAFDLFGKGEYKELWQAYQDDLEVMKAGYGYDEAGPVEKMLIDQILVTYTRYYYYESQLSFAKTYENIEFWEERLNYAQLRFNRAIMLYAKVKTLAQRAPAIIQNNAEVQQVNIST